MKPFLEYFELLEPEVLVAHHWDHALQPPEQGLMAGFVAPESYEQAVSSSGVEAMVPTQLFERYELREGRWSQLAESPIQAGLGLDTFTRISSDSQDRVA